MIKKIWFLWTFVFTHQSVNGSIFRQKIDTDPSTFIINGEPAPSGSFPFMVSLGLINQTNYRHRCGASIISQSFILTAAHCVKDIGNNYDPKLYRQRTGKSLVVIAGIDSLNPSDMNPETEIYLIQQITYNTNYRSITDPYDIAVLRTAKKISFNFRVRPVTLPTSTNPGVVFGKTMTVAGWGVTENGVLSTILRVTKMTSINFMGLRGECKGLDSKFYCMKDLTSDKSNACFGDSGGPLLRRENNEWIQYGLTSFGQNNNEGQCVNTLPGFFTMVPPLLPWVNRQTQNSINFNNLNVLFT